MEHFHFTTVVQEQLKRSEDVLLDKSEEYATAKDRLHNFRVAASMQGCTAKEALAGMMSKHTVSIYDMVREDSDDFTLAMWNEKITDHINYLLLLRALVEEDFMVSPNSKNYHSAPGVEVPEDYRTHNAYAPNTGSDLKIHHTANYVPLQERDAGKQETRGILEERDREVTSRATETTEQD